MQPVKRTAFTMLELLVVIGTIALVVAILVPSLGNSKQYSKAVVCASNVKQLLLGLSLYEAENATFPCGFDGTSTVPPSGGYVGYSEYDRIGWWWFNHILDYSRKNFDRASVIHCPSRYIKGGRLDGDMLCGNYGANQSICKSSSGLESHNEFIGIPLSTNNIPHPGQTVLVLDSGYSIITWWHATDVPPVTLSQAIEDTAYIPGLWINKKRYIWPGQEEDAIGGRHPNKTVNVGFADSHVSRERADDLLVEKDGNNYKNLRPLWQPK